MRVRSAAVVIRIATPTFDAKKFIGDFERAFNTKNYDTAVGYFDRNVEFPVDASGKMERGIDTYRKFLALWGDNFTDTKIELLESVQNGNNVAILQRCQGRHTGDNFELTPGEKIPATNKTVNLMISEFVRLNEQGKVVRDFPIMDTGEFMKQLGMLPSATSEAATRRTVQR